MLKIVLLTALTAFFPGSHQQCFTANDTVPYIKLKQYTDWTQSHRRFSLSLFKALNSQKNPQNIIFSPSSIQDVLLLTYFGASRETEASLAQVLQIPVTQTKPLNWRLYENQKAMALRQGVTPYLLKTAAKIFLSAKLNLRSCMEEKFENDLEMIDYQEDVVWAQNYINDWVAKQTDGHIWEFIKNLSPTSTATIVSAVYFRAKWLNEFDAADTRSLPFHMNPNESRRTNMMVKTGYFDTGYNKELQARFLVLPYQGNRTSMIILLPDKDLNSMIKSMTDGTLSVITTPFFYKTLFFQIRIPKFEHNSNIDLTTSLEQLGIGNTFTQYANFSGFTGKNEVFFNSVIHEAKIEVDEEGATVVAATGEMAGFSPKIPSQSFVCDRPFAYIIYDYIGSKMLFMGTYSEPKTE